MVYVFDYMERVNDRDGIWKVFVYIGYVRSVHVTDKISDPVSLSGRNGSKVRFGLFLTSVDHHVDGLSGHEILDNKSIVTDFRNVDMDLIDADRFR